MRFTDDGEDLKPIGYDIKKPEPVPKERIGDTSVNIVQKKIGPEIPEHIRNELSKVEEDDKENGENKVSGTLDVLKDISALGQDNMEIDEDGEEKQKKRGDRGSK